MINLNDLAEQSLIIAEKRGLATDTLSTLKHCAGEVLEAVDADNALSSCTEARDLYEEGLALELADIIICALTACAGKGINVELALMKAMQKNAGRAYEKSQWNTYV